MKIFTNTAIITILLVLYSINVHAQIDATFSASADGWWTVGDPGSSPGATYAATGGNPGGCIKGTDESIGTWYWLGALTFKGNLSSYYGCNLTFDLKQNTNTWQYNDKDVILQRSDDAVLVYDTPSNPGMSWTSYVVPFTAGAWRWTDLGGTVATGSELLDFLTNCKRIRIRAEYSGLTYETDYIDNPHIGCELIILPVELSDFSASEIEKNVGQLNWTTLTETNCLGFQIEKSTNGLSFDSIAFISGNATTTEMHNYEYIDDALLTTSYYRLKQIDLNGKATYSDIKVIEPANPIANTIVSLYPNPTSDFLFIASDGYNEQIQSIQIHDMMGKLITQLRIDDKNKFQATLDVHKLTSGMYLVTIQTNHALSSYKFQVCK